jgi:glyoxylase I family protein
MLGPIHHVNLMVDDVDAARRFYRDVLGLEEIERPDFGTEGAWFRAGTTQVHLTIGDRPVPDGFQHVAFCSENVSRDAARLTGLGIEVVEPVRIVGAGHQAFVRDPAGNLIELNEAD